MRICPHCAAPMGAQGCVVCGPALSAADAIRAPWHISNSLNFPAVGAPRPPTRPSVGIKKPSLDDPGLVFPELAPNCYECAAFSITHDQVFPRACSRLGFKGRDVPSIFLFNVTGKNCPWFEPYTPPV